MSAKLISSAGKFREEMQTIFTNTRPAFLSRIGGSDTNAVVDLIRVEDAGEEVGAHLTKYIPHVEAFNGFYDLSSNKNASYLQYNHTLRAVYEQMEYATFGHAHVLSLYFREIVNPKLVVDDFPNKATCKKFIDSIITGDTFKCAFPYNWIESIVSNPFTLFWAFEEILQNKTVLVISPFSESIEYNFQNRAKFFKYGYRYPDFTLKTINSPITYSGMNPEMYPDNNWLETSNRLITEISKTDFDIALLGCGSYALPVGSFIPATLKKHAIYVGGVLQLFFGVMGRRYRDEYFEVQINSEFFIEPLEKQFYLDHLPSDTVSVRESFGAYF